MAATVATAFLAWWIGTQAGRIARTQKDVAGMDVLRQTYDNFFNSREMRHLRRAFIKSWWQGEVDGVAARRVLNFFEDIGVFVRKDSVACDVAYDLLSPWVMNYWYAARPFIESERAKPDEQRHNKPSVRLVDRLRGRRTPDAMPAPTDTAAWNRTQSLVEKFEEMETEERMQDALKPREYPYPRDELATFFLKELQELDSFLDLA
jgi:hypothetical protein